MSKLYHAPADCPVCGQLLITTRKGCTSCGSELAGEFASCQFCALDESDLALLTVFLQSRGNLREVEKHLQVSYPTARSRFDALLAKLGIAPNAETSPAHEAPETESEYGQEVPLASAEDQILARVASGELSPEVAAQLLAD